MLGVCAAVALLLAGCGGGAPAPSRVARVEVAPGARLFTTAGESEVLRARVFDPAGVELADESVGWTSSNPDAVSVSGDGTVTARVDVGSALITASAGGVDSFPVSIVVAEPVDGAVLLTDEQVLEGPDAVSDPGAQADPSLPVDQRVLLEGVGTLAPATVIIGAGEAPIGGSVVSATSSAEGLEVVYTPLPVRDLFTAITIDEDIALEAARVVPVDDLAGAVAVRALGAGVTRVESRPDVDSVLGIVCKGEPGSFVTITGLGTSVENDLTYHVHLNGGVDDPRPTELYVDGSLSQKFSSGVSVKSGYSGSYTCKKDIATIPIPIGGVVALVAKPVIPVGVGVNLSGSVQTAGVTLSVETGASVKLKVGFTGDESGDVTLLHDVDPTFDPPGVKFEVVTPAGFRIGASGFVGLMSGIDLDVIGFDPFGLIKAQLGPQQSIDLSSATSQATSKSYASSYDLSLVANAGIGDGIDALYKWLFGEGVSVQPVQFQYTLPLSKSPTGTLTASNPNPAPGDQVHLHVALDADHLTYLTHYNVSKIELYRSVGDDDPALWRTIELSASNQSDFDTVWDTTGEEPGVYTFTAFVVDDILAKVVEVPLEVAADSGVTVTIGGVCTESLPGAIGTLAACTGTTTWDYEQSDDENDIAWQVHTTGSDLTWQQDESNPTYFHLTGATVSWTDVADYVAGCSISSSGSDLRVTNTYSDAGTYVSGLISLQSDGSYSGSAFVWVVDGADDGCFGGAKNESVPLFETGGEALTVTDDGSGGSYLTGTLHTDPGDGRIGALDTSWSFHFAGVAAP